MDPESHRTETQAGRHLPPAEGRAAPLLATGAALLLAVTAATGMSRALDAGSGTDWHGPAAMLGWPVLVACTAAALLFPCEDGRSGRRMVRSSWALLGAAGVSVVAVWTGPDPFRTAANGLALAAVVAFGAGLTPSVRRSSPVTVPQLSVLAGLIVLIAGMAIGVIVDLTGGADREWFLFRAAGARSPGIAVSAVLVGTGLAEWWLAGPRRPATADLWGFAQVLLFCAGWITLVAGTGVEGLDLLVASVLFHAIAAAAFLGRIASPLAGVRWRAAAPGRWFGLSVLFVAVHFGLLAHVAFGAARGSYPDAARVPEWLRFAVDHVVFVGVLACALFGLAAAAGGFRRWIDRTAGAGIGLGLTGYTAGAGIGLGLTGYTAAAAAGSTAAARLFAAALGAGLVIGAAGFPATRRWPPASPAEAPPRFGAEG